MKPTIAILAAVALLLLPIRGPAQTNTVPWFSLNSGFEVSSSSTNLVKSAVGDASYGQTQGPNNSVGLGFLSDTLVSHYALPIQLSLFTSKILEGKNVRLDWTTVSEVNNYGFYVQRSQDTLNSFQVLQNSFVRGHGTTLQTQQYSYTDVTPGEGRWWYRLQQIDLDGTVHYTDAVGVEVAKGANDGALPTVFSLAQNYPNPFNPSTTITVALPRDVKVSLEVYTTLGQKVTQLVDEVMTAGYHTVVFDASRLASGLYLYRMKAADYVATKKMLVVK